MDYSQIGITSFATKTKGISAKFKQEPIDFIVQEIMTDGTVASLEPSGLEVAGSRLQETKPRTSNLEPPTNSKYLHFTLVKTNWDQDSVLKTIARFCAVSKTRFTFAGTKDKFALTAQRISAWNIKPERLAEMNLKDVKLGDFEYANKQLDLGDLWGNRFTIKLTEVENPKKTAESCTKIFKELEKLGGLPNFFGEQRFGMRQNNHIVGRYLLQSNVEAAVKEFLTATNDNDFPDAKEKRKQLAENWGNFKEVGQFPAFMRFENAVINQLIQHPRDFVGAFKKLSKHMYKMFTHSYQSYLFNLMLSERLERRVADIRSAENNTRRPCAPAAGAPSSEGNLVGYDSELSEEEIKLLEKDGLKQENLRIKQFPEASVRGNRRKWLAELKNWSCEPGENSVMLKFDLEKGAYATILLREILK